MNHSETEMLLFIFSAMMPKQSRALSIIHVSQLLLTLPSNQTIIFQGIWNQCILC